MRDTFGEKIFYCCNYIFLTLVGLSCLLPLFHIVSLSLSDSVAIQSGRVGIWPIGFTIKTYANLISGSPVFIGFKNSVIITVIGVAFSICFEILAAYPLSRKYFYGRSFFTGAMVFTMWFSGGLIPSFLLIYNLKLMNSYFSLWLPGLAGTFHVLIMRNNFQSIPSELEEAARMDGCNEWRLLLQIYLPLSKPVIAALALFNGVGFWNQFMNVLLYIRETKKMNLMVIVQSMVKSQQMLQEIANISPDEVSRVTPEGISAAAIVIMIMPILLVYPFLQKYFVKGMLTGSIKG